MPRTIFIGDAQGCLTELRELVEEKIRPSTGDRVIMLGDLINRGPDSAGVVRYVIENGFECVMGNHEYRYVRRWNEPVWGGADIHAILNEDQRAWINALPFFIEEENFVAVHAGLLPGMTAAQTLASADGKRAIGQVRTIAADGAWTSEHSAPGGAPWWSFYRGKKPVFYGHWAEQGLALARNDTYGLDTGCNYGRELSGYCLETGELFQVKARRNYVDPGK